MNSCPEQSFLARLRQLNANALEAGRLAEEQAQRQRRAPLLPIPERNTRAEAAHALLLALAVWAAVHCGTGSGSDLAPGIRRIRRHRIVAAPRTAPAYQPP